MPPALQTVETISSYANRVDGVIRLVLHLPGGPAVTEPKLRLRRPNRGAAVHLPATASVLQDGTLLEAHIDADDLPPGVWRIWMRPGADQPEIRLQARLLVSRKQPIALLPGPAPHTGAAPAIPRPRTAKHAPAASPGRLRGIAVKGVDAALSRLPDEQASRYRAKLAQAARRVTG